MSCLDGPYGTCAEKTKELALDTSVWEPPTLKDAVTSLPRTLQKRQRLRHKNIWTGGLSRKLIIGRGWEFA